MFITLQNSIASLNRCTTMHHCTSNNSPKFLTYLYCTCSPLAVLAISVCWVSVLPSGDSSNVSVPRPAYGSSQATLQDSGPPQRCVMGVLRMWVGVWGLGWTGGMLW